MAIKKIIPETVAMTKTIHKLEVEEDRQTRKPGGKPGPVTAELNRLKNRRAGV